MAKLSYDEAVQRARQKQGSAYAFVPKMRGGKEVGSEIWLITPFEDDVDEDDIEEGEKLSEPWDFSVGYLGENKNGSAPEEGIYGPSEVPEEAKAVMYTPTSAGTEVLDYELEYALQMLREGEPTEKVPRGKLKPGRP